MLQPDEAEFTLKVLGWSVGDVQVALASGPVWQVVALRDGHRLIARAQKQDEAWAAALAMAVSLEVEEAQA